MTKLVAVVGVLVLAPAVFGQTQERPNYSGTWTLVEDGSSSSGRRLLGNRFKVSQSPTTVTIETTVTSVSGSVPPGGGAMVTERKEVPVSVDYICDGEERNEVLPRFLLGVTDNAPPGAVVSAPPTTTYRATWMNGQLIITKQAKIPPALHSVTRLALALDADGSLVVDSLVVPMLPTANGPRQEPPVSVRSIYKKAQ